MPRLPKFVITDYGFPGVSIERGIIENAGGELEAHQCKTEAEVIAATGDANVVLVQFAPVTRAVIQKLSHCRAIVRYGIGLDNIDLEAARDKGILVCNVPDYCIEEVADHTFALALALQRQIPAIDRRVRQGIWKIVPPQPMAASRQSTFVTIGYGRIARAVLERARSCKFHLAICDPYLPSDTRLPNGIRSVTMDEALTLGDIISLHAPLTAETHYLMNREAFAKMKPTSLLVNTARGGLVDSGALVDALDNSRIAGAALDVFEKEPLSESDPLLRCKNLILTSHVAWYSEMSVPELQKLAAQAAVRALHSQSVESATGPDPAALTQ